MTTDSTAGRPWLLFRVDGDMGAGVDARALGQLLQDIAGAARVIADEKLALGPRRGPLNPLELSLAGLRVASVSPGSVNIAFAEPPTAVGQQGMLQWDEERGVELPPKSIDELAREQGLLLRPPPDYFALLSGLWETEEEAEAFRQEIHEGRLR